MAKTIIGLEHLTELAHQSGMAVYHKIDTSFATAWYSLGIANSSKHLRESPKSLEEPISRITNYACKGIKITADYGDDFILSASDLAEKTGLLHVFRVL